MTNIIGDIAGQYDALIKLIAQMPKGLVISVGDMVDRGPKSMEVLHYFMASIDADAIMGNHEHMMLDHHTNGGFYEPGLWIEYNGGAATMKSYQQLDGYAEYDLKQHLEYLKNLPYYIRIDDVLITHAFPRPYMSEDQFTELGGNSWNDASDVNIMWNRGLPVRRDDCRLQIAGHNSQFGLREWADDKGTYAICLDDSKHKRLTGLHLETMTIYQQEF